MRKENIVSFFFQSALPQNSHFNSDFKNLFFKLFFLIIKIVKLKYRVFHDDALKNKVITLSHY